MDILVDDRRDSFCHNSWDLFVSASCGGHHFSAWFRDLPTQYGATFWETESRSLLADVTSYSLCSYLVPHSLWSKLCDGW